MTLELHQPSPLDIRRANQEAQKVLRATLRRRTPHARVTAVLVALNVLVFCVMAIQSGGIGFRSGALVRWGAIFGPRTADGEWWRLFTGTFLHVNPLHLGFNMMALLMVGPVLERLIGARAFALFYVCAGLVGAAASLWVHPLTVSVGASGAIMGLYGVLLLMMFERSPGAPPRGVPVASLERHDLQIQLQSAVSMIASTLFYGLLDPRADNAAHVGGLAAGCLFGWLGGRHIESFLPSRRVAAAALAVAVTCCAMSIAGRQDLIDLRPAVFRVFETDSRALSQYSKAAASHADAKTVTRLIEAEILPAFARQRATLAATGRVLPEQRQLLADLQQYLAVREEFWRLRAASAGSKDDEARRRVEAADRSADAVMRRLLQVR